jgi:hypothetical protein
MSFDKQGTMQTDPEDDHQADQAMSHTQKRQQSNVERLYEGVFEVKLDFVAPMGNSSKDRASQQNNSISQSKLNLSYKGQKHVQKLAAKSQNAEFGSKAFLPSVYGDGTEDVILEYVGKGAAKFEGQIDRVTFDGLLKNGDKTTYNCELRDINQAPQYTAQVTIAFLVS